MTPLIFASKGATWASAGGLFFAVQMQSGCSSGDGSSLVDTLRYAPDAARLKSASLGVSCRASAYADVLVGAGRPKVCGPTG